MDTNTKIALAGVIISGISAFVAWLVYVKPNDSLPGKQSNQTAHDNKNSNQFGDVNGPVTINQGSDSNQLVESLVQKLRDTDRSNFDLETENKSLKEALTALLEKEGPSIDAARAELEEGRTDAAEDIFQEILNSKKAEGEAAYKEAAAAARHIGALAFLHDTEKALLAYRQAVDLDPDDPDGWNQLGHLLRRKGDIDQAQTAYEKILSLGNRIEDKSVIATAFGNLGNMYQIRGDLDPAEAMYQKALALNEELDRKEGMASIYGNLGNLYRTRGDLDQAEEMYQKSLALNKELGRKEGIAIQYGNLGNLHKTRGNLEQACGFWLKSAALFGEIDAQHQVKKVRGLMEKAGCEGDNG